MNVVEMKRKPISELAILAKELNVPDAAGMRKQDLIFRDSPGPDREKRYYFRRRRPGNIAGRIRVPQGC